MLAIEARGLRKTYGGGFSRGAGKEALAGLDLAISEGAAFGLIGLNGAGKTTFIKALLGVVRPSAGVVRVLGKDPEDPSARAQIGYLPERLFLPHAFTPVQFLASVARLKGIPAADDEVRRQIGRVGLSGEEGRRIGGFSKGMRQRLGLAAALLGGPMLLVLDEPTDGVDPLGRAEIRRILAEERARGATLFLNSHLLSETERVCDRIGILSGGRLLREGPIEALCGSETRYRVRFAPPVEVAALQGLGFRPGEGEGVFVVDAPDPTALNDLLDQARRTGARLVELAHDVRDLEDVLAEALGQGGERGHA
ncbi:ABC transporter ATP-binding protein [Polyangium jinanense]|uniref:ABC transporter ATP-binding protein n=1 Tax=Polyangium jinanense TaxID=2829994 RepID=A0A9X4AVD2_9BACT|nr:ABC transporter ATP-binding protein [Polyangium jinanense]MDC3959554.1 ABC transporter ATP-binding protein [Polyangium jinanense]MDC3986153.1 ABC transporter ATP-binding protein [Polyangium jinanense]